ncbi:hypothetical protein [Spirosoma agri]|uniref:Uncharacterized protein n=1 Tax=Spirosoma agri TaxID=1987381 RepID=A0A6M0IG13_9BACT|nr:hypothetical protein [Spirosoma agri]NEU67230.1 hypothetical protein [Spirosoma agri]
MKTTSKSRRGANLYPVLVDDVLKERSISSTLFTRKIEKATRIMSLVRAKQNEQQDAQ